MRFFILNAVGWVVSTGRVPVVMRLGWNNAATGWVIVG